MKVDELLSKVKDSTSVERVFGEPYEKDGVTVIPAAIIAGGAGGGTGQDAERGEGEGGGFGMAGRPAGAYVIKNGEVTWRPAVDPNRVLRLLGVIAVVWMLTRPFRRGARAAAG